MAVRDHLERILAAFDCIDREPCFFEPFSKVGASLSLVLDDQNFHRLILTSVLIVKAM